MTDERQQWEVQEDVDDAVASNVTTPEMLSEYVYEMVLGGRKVHGITAAGIAHLALENLISIESCERTEDEMHIAYTAWAIKLDTQQRSCGYFSQAKNTRGHSPDEFAGAKAMTKAKRNARKDLLPATLLSEAISMFVELAHGGSSKQRERSPSSATVPAHKRDKDAARKHCFAVYEHNLKPVLAARGIPEAAFWAEIGTGLGVKSRSELSLTQWNTLSARFANPDMVPELEAAAAKHRDSVTAAASANAESDSEIPF